jgi:molybdopterin converting factor small subunit
MLPDSTEAAAPITVQVRAFAAARAVLGWSQKTVTVPVSSATVAAVTSQLIANAPSPQQAETVLNTCAILLNGTRVTTPAVASIPTAATLDLLPPFAGG